MKNKNLLNRIRRWMRPLSVTKEMRSELTHRVLQHGNSSPYLQIRSTSGSISSCKYHHVSTFPRWRLVKARDTGKESAIENHIIFASAADAALAQTI